MLYCCWGGFTGVEVGVDDASGRVDVAADDVPDRARRDESVDVGFREVAAVDVHGSVIGGAGAVQVRVGRAGDVQHTGDDPVGLDGLLRRPMLEDRRTGQERGGPAAFLGDADGGRRCGAGPGAPACAVGTSDSTRTRWRSPGSEGHGRWWVREPARSTCTAELAQGECYAFP